MREVPTLAVIGAGIMGSGIAQKMATEGFRVLLVDVSEAQLDRAIANIRKTLREGAALKIFREWQVHDILGRVVKTNDWADLGQAELVVEAVSEDLGVKRDVFGRLGKVAKPDAVLATTTSSFYVRDLANATTHPERVLGLHYFFQPAKNRLVEIIPTSETSKAAIQRAQAIQDVLRKTSITSADAPGFIVNRFFIPWLNEAVRVLAERIADIPTIEAAAKERFGSAMGPFELMNLTGIPAALHAATTLGKELGRFYEPATLLADAVQRKAPWALGGTPDRSRSGAIDARLLGAVFLAASAIVDEKVGSIEAVDIGARAGPRWRLGPFELMNQVGIGEAAALAASAGRPYGLELTPALAQRREPFSSQVVETAIDDRIATLTISRPDKHNALDENVVAQLEEQFEKQAGSPAIDGIVITGKGDTFATGTDASWLSDRIDAKRIEDIVAFARRSQQLLRRFAAVDKVVIAKVDGLSSGSGVELALACDYILGTRRASFGFPECGIGIHPGFGGTQRLSRRIGVSLAKAFILTGNPMSADAASEVGMLDRAATRGDMKTAIAELVRRGKPAERHVPASPPRTFESLASLFPAGTPIETILGTRPASPEDQRLMEGVRAKAPIALRLANELIDGSSRWSLDQGLAEELSRLAEVLATQDAHVGLASVGRAQPSFIGD